MSRVLQAVDSVHQTGVFCLALVPPNYLPKTPLGGIHLHETRKKFLEGSLHPANVLMCPHTCVTNLPKPCEHRPDVTPSAVHVGNIVQGAWMAWAQGRELGVQEEEPDSSKKHQFLTEILRYRNQTTPDHILFTLLNSKPTQGKSWPPQLQIPDLDGFPNQEWSSPYSADMQAQLTITCSQLHKRSERIGSLLMEKGHLNTGDHVALIYPPGIELIAAFYGCLYVGCVPVTIRPPHPQNVSTTLPTVKMILEVNKSVAILSNTLIIKHVTKPFRARGINLSCVRACCVIVEERPRIQLTMSFTKLFANLGLSPRAINTSFGCRVCIGISLQGASCPDPTTVYVDLRALRNDRVTLLEKGSPHSLCLMESGKLLPGVKVAIANPDTKGQCADFHLGEVSMMWGRGQFDVGPVERGAEISTTKIWVSSPQNATGYFTIYGDESLHLDHFDAHLATGDTQTSYARTGYLGFMRRTELTQSDGGRHDAIFVVGALDETIMLRGMRYHPPDIETCVHHSHRKICECAVFTWKNLLVVVVELDGNENEALDLVPLVTNVVLEEHYMIVGVGVVVDPGVIPINSR